MAFTLYSSAASQWAQVPHLALSEKGFQRGDYNIEEVDLVAGGNFDPDYIDVNPNGTIPSLITPKLPTPLVDSREILKFIDNERATTGCLDPQDPALAKHAQQVIELVHDERISTNLILLQARNPDEMRSKQSSMWKEFVDNRQRKLERYSKEFPKRSFYSTKLEENTKLHRLYFSTNIEDANHQSFYSDTQAQYRTFAEGLETLDGLVKLPYIVGDSITSADLHVVPWLAHAMWGAGGHDIGDFEPLEQLIRVTVPDFKIGQNLRTWWIEMSKRASFQAVYPQLH